MPDLGIGEGLAALLGGGDLLGEIGSLLGLGEGALGGTAGTIGAAGAGLGEAGAAGAAPNN